MAAVGGGMRTIRHPITLNLICEGPLDKSPTKQKRKKSIVAVIYAVRGKMKTFLDARAPDTVGGR